MSSMGTGQIAENFGEYDLVDWGIGLFCAIGLTSVYG